MKHDNEVIIDLTKPLDSALQIYSDADYRDPEFSCIEWSSVEKQGYRVSALSLGTQTGTHIDAPAHFDSSGKCLDALPLESLIGRYFLVDLLQNTTDDQATDLCSAYKDEPILFVRSTHSGASSITRGALEILLRLPPLVWVVAGDVELTAGSPLEFHRRIARKGKYLIENVNAELSLKARPGGELIAMPLRLVGTSGSPCRVAIRQSSL
jgi:arylformamidase